MNTDNILVTVVMCVYNTPNEYLCEAVGSILAQTHKNFELIIVDDASTIEGSYGDDLFADSRITIVKNEVNSGPSYSRNVAFAMAKGKYIAIMDSDDISLPQRLEKQVEYLENHPEVVVCGTWFKHFGEKSNEVKRTFDDNDYYRCCLLFGNAPTMLNPSVMIRKSTMEKHHIVYDERLRKAEDYKMWVQMSKVGIFTNLNEILLYYRVHKAQTSQKLRTKDTSEYDWLVWKEQFDALGIDLTESEKNMLMLDYRSSRVAPYDYYIWLEKLLKANETVGEYNQEKLRKRVTEQWVSKIYNTKNPFTLAGLYFKLPKAQKSFLLKAELNRLRRNK